MKARPRGAIFLTIGLLCVGAVTLLPAGRRVLRRITSRPTARQLAPASPPDTPLPKLEAPRVLVEKRSRRLTVFDGPTAVKSYRVALGWGRGDKAKEGDGCTPEGEFYICYRNPRSKYHLSLGLSYPNVEDAERGLENGLISKPQHDRIVQAVREMRRPPWNTPLGGEIMIHGHGAGSDWTAGCMALENEDIEELYHALPDRTTVEIVP